MISSVYHFRVLRLAPLFLLTAILPSLASAESCLTCHESIRTQFRGNSHHIQGVEISDRHCYSCHWEAGSDGSVNSEYHRKDPAVQLVVWIDGKRPGEYLAGKSAVSFTPAAMGGINERQAVAGITVHCLSCHNDATLQATPFSGDRNSPAQYAWDKESIAARYSNKNTTTWGKYSTAASNRKMQITKAFSAHGNTAMNQGGWKELTGYDGDMPLTRGGTAARNVECFDCHNSHGSTIAGTTASYRTPDKNSNGGLLKQTVSGQSGYNTDYQPAVNSYSKSRNPFSSGAGLCFDCHENAAAGATPWGYNTTFGATKPIMGYKDTLGFGDGMKGSSGKFGGRQSRGEISSSHLKAGAPLSHKTSAQINGLCTPCHDPHGVSRTLGENMAYAVPLLKGSWLTSPYREDGPPDRFPTIVRSGIDGSSEYNRINRESGSSFNRVNRDAGSNFSKEADFNRVNRDVGSNFSKETTDYNKVNRAAGSNFATEADYNRVNRDTASNFNRVNRDAGSNFTKEADFNRVNRDAGSNFSKETTDYNKVNRAAGSNFATAADYNRVNRDTATNFNRDNRDAGSNFSKEADFNRVNRDAGSNFTKETTDYNKVNRAAGSNFAKEADYNSVNRDTASNFNRVNRDAGSNFSKEADYNRVNRDAGSNFTKETTDYNKVNRAAGSNLNKESAGDNQVNRDASSNFAQAAAGQDRQLDSNTTNRDANSNFGKSGSQAPREPMQGMKYHLDRNTFGVDKRISENDTKFAGLCLSCHQKENLTGTAPTAQVHKTVNGWGSNKEHSFPCSKCHQAHNSGLPRLMQTNCFESGPAGLRDKSAASWPQTGKDSQPLKSADPAGKIVGCHVKQFGRSTASSDNRNWKEVSPW